MHLKKGTTSLWFPLMWFFFSGLLIQDVWYTKCSFEYGHKETTSSQEMTPILTAMMHLQCLVSRLIVKRQMSAWLEFFLFKICKNNHKHTIATMFNKSKQPNNGRRFNHYSPVWPLVQVESPCLTMSWRRRPCFEVVTFERTHRIPSENSPIKAEWRIKNRVNGENKSNIWYAIAWNYCIPIHVFCRHL